MNRESSSEGSARQIHRKYRELQSLGFSEVPASDGELKALAANWQAVELPALQRLVVDEQLANLTSGIVDPVFVALASALQAVKLPAFSLLDAACATGYYGEAIGTLDPRPITYVGCDYSSAMIESAKAHYPDVHFSVQDLTALQEADRGFDVVLMSGVLEHVPEYRRAISEACRVAGRYVIVHRCPITSSRSHIRTIGSQYTIQTPRTHFSMPVLRSEFLTEDFELVKSIEVYPKARSWRRRARRRAARWLGRDQRRTLTLVFRRREVRGRA